MELSIRGVNVSLAELRQDVQAAKEKGLAGQHAFMPETVEALLDLIDTLKPGFSHEDIIELFDERCRALFKELPWPGDRTVEEHENAIRWKALEALETAGLARREKTSELLIWHFVPTNGPSVPMYHYRNS